jgi:hypothetical protein
VIVAPSTDSPLDGWIGGLIAAAVTVGATIWWEARSVRRQRLDAAALELVSAARAVEHSLRTGEVGLREDTIRMLYAIELVRAQAGRHHWPFRWRWLRPWRSGLEASVSGLHREWIHRLSLFEQDVRGAGEEVEGVATGLRLCGLWWLSTPWRYFPNRDLSDALWHARIDLDPLPLTGIPREPR